MATLHYPTIGHLLPAAATAESRKFGLARWGLVRALYRYLRQRRREWKQTVLSFCSALLATGLWLHLI